MQVIHHLDVIYPNAALPFMAWLDKGNARLSHAVDCNLNSKSSWGIRSITCKVPWNPETLGTVVVDIVNVLLRWILISSADILTHQQLKLTCFNSYQGPTKTDTCGWSLNYNSLNVRDRLPNLTKTETNVLSVDLELNITIITWLIPH